MQLNIARREDIKLRVGISGASGSGKTYSALLMAYGMTEDWAKIAVVDTENGSANLYSDLGDYNVLNLNEPYSPEHYNQSPTRSVEYSIENFLKLHNVHLDIIEEYGGNNY